MRLWKVWNFHVKVWKVQRSIGQMSLMAIIEDEFQIEFEPDEIIAFTSYQAGLDILRKRNIEF